MHGKLLCYKHFSYHLNWTKSLECQDNVLELWDESWVNASERSLWLWGGCCSTCIKYKIWVLDEIQAIKSVSQHSLNSNLWRGQSNLTAPNKCVFYVQISLARVLPANQWKTFISVPEDVVKDYDG